MLTMLGSPRRCCDGITRRETLKIGALSALGGFGLPQFLAASEAGAVGFGKAKNVILLFLLGGAATQDMFDLKPNAPAEVRSAVQADRHERARACRSASTCRRWPSGCTRSAVIRSLNHKAGCHNTLPSYTGLRSARCRQHDHQGHAIRPAWARSASTCRPRPRASRAACPTMSIMPCYLGWGQAIRRPGPYGGFLGKRLRRPDDRMRPDQARRRARPVARQARTVLGTPRLASQHAAAGHHARPLQHPAFAARPVRPAAAPDRRQRTPSIATASSSSQAYDILTSSKLKEAFDLSRRRPETGRALRRPPVRQQHAHGPPAGRAGRAVRQRHLGSVLGPRQGRLRRLGHAHQQLRRSSRTTSSPASTRPSRPCWKTSTPAACSTKR